jgi:hypothetical protein
MADQNKNQIDKALEALNLGLDMEPDSGIEVPVDNSVEFDPDFELQEDGSAIIPDDTPMQPPTDHGVNLAEFVEEDELARLASDLIGFFESDKETRKIGKIRISKDLICLVLNMRTAHNLLTVQVALFILF